jgi:ABC-type nickel/cobalt efflux system permease component RcnA
MSTDSLFIALLLAGVTVGSLHTIAPDHWVPFAALARARRWSGARTAVVTMVCGMGHVTVSVLLGVLALFFGLKLLEAFARQMESLAGLLLIGFGVVYGLWGWRRAVSARLQAHAHAHGHVHWHAHQEHGHARPHLHASDDRAASKMTAMSLFLLFSADPCVAVVPILFAAAPLGVAKTLVIVIAYELATILTMVALVLPARAAANRVRAEWVARYGDATAGAVIVAVGVVVAALGW